MNSAATHHGTDLGAFRGGRAVIHSSPARASVYVAKRPYNFALSIDPTGASRFYTDALSLDTRLNLRASEEPTTGFRGFTLSLIVSQPAIVKGLIDSALDAGATAPKPPRKVAFGATVAS